MLKDDAMRQIRTCLSQFAFSKYLRSLTNGYDHLLPEYRFYLSLAYFHLLTRKDRSVWYQKLIKLNLIDPKHLNLTPLGKQYVKQAIPHPVIQVLIQEILMTIFERIPMILITVGMLYMIMNVSSILNYLSNTISNVDLVTMISSGVIISSCLFMIAFPLISIICLIIVIRPIPVQVLAIAKILAKHANKRDLIKLLATSKYINPFTDFELEKHIIDSMFKSYYIL